MKYIVFLFSFLFLNLHGFSQIDEGNPKNSNTYSGEIYIGSNLLPEGTVYLINHNKNNYNTERETDVFNGSFEFNNLKQGNYTLYVIPKQDYDFFYFPKYIPSYSGNSYKWENSQSYEYSNGYYSNDINLVSYPESFYGHCNISGKIKFDRGYRGEKVIPIPIILLNELKEPMDFRIADENEGEFLFEYLPNGTYYIHPEIPGIITEDYKIDIKSTNLNNNVNFMVNNFIIKPDVNDNNLYPEVGKNFLRVFLDNDIESSFVCELTDLSGKLISKNLYSTKDIFINTSGITVGIYLLRVRSFDNSIVETTKVYINNY